MYFDRDIKTARKASWDSPSCCANLELKHLKHLRVLNSLSTIDLVCLIQSSSIDLDLTDCSLAIIANMNAISKQGALLLQHKLLHHKHHTWDVMEFVGQTICLQSCVELADHCRPA